MGNRYSCLVRCILLCFYMIYMSACSTLTAQDQFVKEHNDSIGRIIFDSEFGIGVRVGTKGDYFITGNSELNDLVDDNAPRTKEYDYFLNVQKVQKLNDHQQKWSFVRDQCRYSYFVKRDVNSKKYLETDRWVLVKWQFDSKPEYCTSTPNPCPLSIWLCF